MAELTIPYNYIPRDYQRALYNSLAQGFRRGVAVWHRRAGKDKTLINIVAKEMFKRVGSYYYFFPSYAQGRKILWDGMDRGGFAFLKHIPEELRESTNSTEMKIKCKNGSLFQVVGSDNIDSIVGTNPIGCVFSEYALQDPRGWDFVRPILRENGGWSLFNFTPRGYNHGWDIFEMAQGNPEWFCELLTVRDTQDDGRPVISEADVESERKDGMSEDLIQQEFYCSFEASIPGAYYAEEMRLARENGRITRVPVDRNLNVSTWWDIGIDDSMTLWLTQDVGQSINAVAYYENYNEAFSHYVNYLSDFRDKYKIRFEEHVLPHDGESRDPKTGKTSVEWLRGLLSDAGLTGSVRCAPKPARKEDGIEAVRRILPKVYFDREETKDGVNALTQFRKEWDPKKRLFRHVHDWASHGADSFQTMALAHRFYDLTGQTWRPDRKKISGKFSRILRRVAA